MISQSFVYVPLQTEQMQQYHLVHFLENLYVHIFVGYNQTIEIGYIVNSALISEGDLDRPKDVVLAGKLPVHQGDLWDAAQQDGRVDGERWEGHRSHHGRQSLHLSRVQEGEGQLPCEYKMVELLIRENLVAQWVSKQSQAKSSDSSHYKQQKRDPIKRS